jgi:mgtE-like transporter
MRLARSAAARFVALVRADAPGVRAGFVALVVSTVTGLIAGVTLGKIDDTITDLPGLLILLPAAVGMRGNVFGALGSRLGTSVHTGTFRLSRRLDTEVGQNLAAAFLLSMSLAWILAVAAKGIAAATGHASISVVDYVVISVVGGLIPIAVVMAITVAVTALGAQRGWDVDNVAAPIVTAAADSVTLPSLWLATHLVGRGGPLTPTLGVLCTIAGVASLIAGLRARARPQLRRIVQESVPVLVVSGVISMFAGLTLQGRVATLARYQVLFVLVPPLLSLSGSLAGILSSRVATKLHLGLLDPGRFSIRAIGEDLVLVYVLSSAIFTVLGTVAAATADLLQLSAPSVASVIGAALLAGVLATTLTILVGYAAALATFRLELDPDNFGIPLTAACSDLLGAIALMLALVALGLTS